MIAGCSQEVTDMQQEQIPIYEKNTQTPLPKATHASQNSYEDIENKIYGWGFVRKKGSPPQVTLEEQERLQKYDAFYIGNGEEKKIYLTFDEGYENGFTDDILDVLRDNGVKAAFFVTMPYLEGEQALVGRMIDEGHIVGNHTVHHPNLSKCSVEEVKSELNALNEKSIELYGYEMKYMRPPEGAYSERTLAVAQDLGYKTIFWSHAYKDWDVNVQKGADYAISQVVPYFHNGEILLLHAVSKDNADSLDSIIKQAKKQGYTFESLDNLQNEQINYELNMNNL